MATRKTGEKDVAAVVEPVGPAMPVLPSDEEVAAARAARKAAGTYTELAPGTVLGLPAGWASAKLDPALAESRKAELRAKWAAKGWIQLEGLQQVIGYPTGCEVWVKRSEDYESDRRELGERIRQMAAQGSFLLGQA